MHRPLIAICACLFALAQAGAQTFTLDDPASPVRVTFDGSSARMTATVKATGALWRNPDAGGGHLVTLSSVSQPDPTHLTAIGNSTGGGPITIALALDPASGDLEVALSADPTLNLSATLRYPYAFLPPDGSGFTVMPIFDGYVIPTTQTTWNVPSSHSRLEWFGGVDNSMDAGWMMIARTAADMELTAETVTIAGQQRRCGVFRWNGSNANPGSLANRFSYDRRCVIHFFAGGGYVAQAKRFRDYAASQGWLVTLNQKAQSNPDVSRMLGAPVLYLWGDGRSQALLDELSAAGVDRAMVQVSINHVDQNNAFPNQQYAGGRGWADAVRAKGYIPGIYDIYARYSAGQTQPPFNGFNYLWPTTANPQWVYRNADGTLDTATSINNALAATFASQTRLPTHNSVFGFDAYFSDVVCAVMPREDYDTSFGHAKTRAQDIQGRAALLAAVSVDHHRLAGVEQLKSWAIPYSHWGEGVFWLGGSPSLGSFNNNAYPQIMTDVMDPGAAEASVLDVGFRVPLFDLVYHDCVLATVHWHRAHNKLLYAWDLNDQFALLRGQAPLLHLVYSGAPGSVGRAIAGATDARDGSFWDTRWTTPRVRERVLRTINTVSAWHREVGALEMTGSRVLTPDFSVQLSEFSANAGISGRGIVVNFGTYAGNHSMGGQTWTGVVRGQSLTVPVGGYATYTFAPPCDPDLNQDGNVDQDDVTYLIDVVGGGNNPAGIDPDFNHDGNADQDDITALINTVGGGGCP